MIVLTYDTDHMTESMMEAFVAQILPRDLPGTIFCTQPYQCLKGIGLEIGVHPFLTGIEPWIKTTMRLIERVGNHGSDVVGVRSHSLVSSQVYSRELFDNGIIYQSQNCVPWNIDLPIYWHSWGIAELSIRFMDNVNLWAAEKSFLIKQSLLKSIIESAVKSENVFCFDFHPIHIMLNTSSIQDYEAWRRAGNPELLMSERDTTYGVRNFYEDLISSIRLYKPSISSAHDAVLSEQGKPKFVA